MEIKELSLIENLSEDGKETSAIDSVIGGHGYGHSYDYGHSYSKADCPHPYYTDHPYGGVEYAYSGGSGAGQSKWWKDKWWKKYK